MRGPCARALMPHALAQAVSWNPEPALPSSRAEVRQHHLRPELVAKLQVVALVLQLH